MKSAVLNLMGVQTITNESNNLVAPMLLKQWLSDVHHCSDHPISSAIHFSKGLEIAFKNLYEADFSSRQLSTKFIKTKVLHSFSHTIETPLFDTGLYHDWDFHEISPENKMIVEKSLTLKTEFLVHTNSEFKVTNFEIKGMKIYRFNSSQCCDLKEILDYTFKENDIDLIFKDLCGILDVFNHMDFVECYSMKNYAA